MNDKLVPVVFQIKEVAMTRRKVLEMTWFTPEIEIIL
jgi:hypothetical protein